MGRPGRPGGTLPAAADGIAARSSSTSAIINVRVTQEPPPVCTIAPAPVATADRSYGDLPVPAGLPGIGTGAPTTTNPLHEARRPPRRDHTGGRTGPRRLRTLAEPGS
ncbi:hypothetical protein OG594_40665 [Streptomyces sp. NBC_01214]|uniref:hypothetical protein n=1 Tax=Streptomyces sp. NBC_01214 TaxID=2903777 RepID=UPI002254A084|nr:hypothetical protein [Streptomyces sp. NBC_01214]MCX4807838.1 hypothetical protein [Streptomyces sp. NBC_01214]